MQLHWPGARPSARTFISCYGMSESHTNALACFPGKQRLGATACCLARFRAASGSFRPRGRHRRAGGSCGSSIPPLRLDTTTRRQPKGVPGRLVLHRRPVRPRCGRLLLPQGRADELLRIAGQWSSPGGRGGGARRPETARGGVCRRSRPGWIRPACAVCRGHNARRGQSDCEARCENGLPKYSRPKWICEVDELPRTRRERYSVSGCASCCSPSLYKVSAGDHTRLDRRVPI